MTTENDENDGKNPVEKLGVMDDDMLKASKELFLPDAFDSLEIKLSMATSGGPMEIKLSSEARWDWLSEKGVARAKKQGYSKGDSVSLAFLNTSANKKLDIVSKKGGKCDACHKVLFEGDGMLVKFSHGVNAEGTYQTINKQARLDELADVDPHVKSGTGYTYLVCSTDECRKKIDEIISRRIKEGDVTPPKESSGGCFIATATYGSPLAKEVRTLYEFRDSILLQSNAGRRFVSLYYRFSPSLSRHIEHHRLLKKVSALALAPVIRMARQSVEKRKKR